MKYRYESYVEAKKNWRAPMRDVSAIEVRAALSNPQARFRYADDHDKRLTRVVAGILSRGRRLVGETISQWSRA